MSKVQVRKAPLAGWTLVCCVLVGCGSKPVEGEDKVAYSKPLEGEDQMADSMPLKSKGPTSCDSSVFPMKVSLVVQECCQLGNATWHVGPTGDVVHRTYGAACSQADGGIACGNPPLNACFYGPCGSHNFPIGGPPSYVFIPVSNPGVCGWQAGGPDGGYDPEPYTDQKLYPDVPAECPYTSCLAGIPLVSLTVTAIASDATGHVSSKPDGIDLQGAGSVTGGFSDTKVELTADLLGAHARAVFSGDCSATGNFGKSVKCKLTLGPDKNVTVTYECESGFTC